MPRRQAAISRTDVRTGVTTSEPYLESAKTTIQSEATDDLRARVLEAWGGSVPDPFDPDAFVAAIDPDAVINAALTRAGLAPRDLTPATRAVCGMLVRALLDVVLLWQIEFLQLDEDRLNMLVDPVTGDEFTPSR